jgi:hypothetical protein
MSTSDGVNRFISSLAARRLQLIRHGSFIGVRGSNLRRVPVEVWEGIRRLKPQLLSILPDSPSPFKQRRTRR